MKDKRIILSKRLQMLADMISRGNRVADVGCDHGFLSIWLVQAQVSPKALAMDVRKGPLAAAKGHVEEYGLGKYIETRLSDGLQSFEAGEADSLVCAGMGGRLMERILTESMEKAKTLKELVLQPQSELEEFRAFLRREGFVVVQENAVCEDGKYYFAMKAVWRAEARHRAEECCGAAAEDKAVPDCGIADAVRKQEQRVYDRYGEGLLLQKNPVLISYLKRQLEKLQGIADSLAGADSERQQARLREVSAEIADLEYALGLTEGNIYSVI